MNIKVAAFTVNENSINSLFIFFQTLLNPILCVQKLDSVSIAVFLVLDLKGEICTMM